jgi:drug/metabolite transporter (DMT)-like permease
LRATVARLGDRPLGVTYIALAACAWSLAGILQRQLHMSLASQLAGRAVFASAAMFVFVAIAERGHVVRAFRAIGWAGIGMAALLATSSVTFITALNDTAVANVMVVQALVPLAAALLGMLVGEQVRPRTWVAMGVAGAGFAVIAGAPTHPGLAGMGFSFVAMLSYAGVIVIARHRAHVSMAPATCLSQVLAFAVFAPFAHVSEMGGSGVIYLALLGVVQLGLGLFLLSLGARLIPAAEVALIAQLENVLAPLWVWLAGIEHPSAEVIIGGVIVIGAVGLQIAGSRPAVRGRRSAVAEPLASSETAPCGGTGATAALGD